MFWITYFPDRTDPRQMALAEELDCYAHAMDFLYDSCDLDSSTRVAEMLAVEQLGVVVFQIDRKEVLRLEDGFTIEDFRREAFLKIHSN